MCKYNKKLQKEVTYMPKWEIPDCHGVDHLKCPNWYKSVCTVVQGDLYNKLRVKWILLK